MFRISYPRCDTPREAAIRNILAAILFLTLALPASPASAHAQLVSADPPPGATLTTPPREIRLTFTEPLVAGSVFVVYAGNFNEVPGISPVIDPHRPDQLVAAAVPPLPPEAYTVQWLAVTADGARTKGSYSFSVAVVDQPPGRPFALQIAAVLLLALGALAFALWTMARRFRRS